MNTSKTTATKPATIASTRAAHWHCRSGHTFAKPVNDGHGLWCPECTGDAHGSAAQNCESCASLDATQREATARRVAASQAAGLSATLWVYSGASTAERRRFLDEIEALQWFQNNRASLKLDGSQRVVLVMAAHNVERSRRTYDHKREAFNVPVCS